MNSIPKLRPRLLSVEETALELHVSTKTVRRLIKTDNLPVHRIGRCLRVSQDDLRVYLNQTRA